MNTKVKLIATAAMGLEALVAKEVRQLGYEDTVVENGKVIFEADHHAIARCNLWLRTADRIKLVVGEFQATTYDELFEETKALPWERYITEDGKFPVTGKSHKSKLFSVPDCQSIVKKAIVEKLKQKHGIANWLEETGAEYKIEVALLKDNVLLTLDTSGAGLHKRGYRIGQGGCPPTERNISSCTSAINELESR
ncbi:N6-adenine-specific DNA methylase [Gracilibacillus boraciitolerans JCM 21714]|uniref:N6-adenine-specific DNA methylase n=1 Tax=Gracilibacillus boraciitolerans JCM 21714 TaxID=1298598 RepID=W4VE25_9BACI|nr:N6-adenine-specific DNA methylase [Gracilibacillus boraciitolerans JCM 21714]